MTCKNCGKELDAEEMICAQCGFDNTEEPENTGYRRINPWKIAFPSVVSLGLLLVLGWLLYFGVTGYWFPRANDINNKANYTVNESQLFAGRNAVVATMGKHKLTNAQFQVFFLSACNNYSGQYSSKEPLDKQIFDKNTGLTWQQYLLETALNSWKQYRNIMDMALEAQFQLPKEHQDYLNSLETTLAEMAQERGFDSVDALLSEDICTGCTYADYRYFLEVNYYANLYFTELVNNLEISLEEIDTYFVENPELMEENGITRDETDMVDYRDILVKVEKLTEENADTRWDTCKNAAQAILDQWLQMGTTEKNFTQLAMEKSEDSNSNTNGGLVSFITRDYLTRVDVRHILIMPEGGTKSEDGKTTTYSEAEWEACRQKAQAVYDEYLNGSLTEERFAELAKTHSQDGNADKGGIYTDVTKNYMVEAFDSWIFDIKRQSGDTGLVKTEYGYHVMYFVHRDGDLDSWLFDSDRKPGDYSLIKTDEGYHIVYFKEINRQWIRLCRELVREEKANALLEELSERNDMNVRYYNIRLGE